MINLANQREALIAEVEVFKKTVWSYGLFLISQLLIQIGTFFLIP
nr:hypothetical protein [Acinetobacter baumannii]